MPNVISRVNAPYAETQPGRSGLDKLSFYALLFYFALQPFSDALHRIVLVGGVFDLACSLLFLGLAGMYLISGRGHLGRCSEAYTILLWLSYLVFAYLFFDHSSGRYEEVVDSPLYAFRFLAQPATLFFVLLVRGMRRDEIKAFVTAIVLSAPFAIVRAYQDFEIVSLEDAKSFAAAGKGIAYNTFVPYMTFPLFGAVYLLFAYRNLLVRALVGIIAGIILLFILSNQSRQSVLFIIFGFTLYWVFSKNAKLLIIVIFVAGAVVILIDLLNLADTVRSRFFSQETLLSSRPELMLEAISSIRTPAELLFGKGFSIRLGLDVSPHNNYIYSVIRFGLVGALLMFLPFLRALFRAVRCAWQNRDEPDFDNNFSAFIIIGLTFTVFHSFFGYPHMDSLSSGIVWFGLGSWLTFRRETGA